MAAAYNRERRESNSPDCDSFLNLMRRPVLKQRSRSNSPMSPKRQSKSDRSFPYKLLRFPTSVTTFWDRTPLGNAKTLNWCNSRTPVVCLNKSVLISGKQLLAATAGGKLEASGLLKGTILVSETENIMTFSLKSMIQRESLSKRQSFREGAMECQARIHFQLKSQAISPRKSEQDFHDESVGWFDEMNRNEADCFHRNMYFKANCAFDDFADGTVCDVRFHVSTLPYVFNLVPVRPMAIISTALSKGLSDPTRNGFLHGEPKSGYVTMDQIHRLLLVLDSDPKATSLSLMGLWISGVESIGHPFVWAACSRFAKKTLADQTLNESNPPESFLVLIYENQSRNVTFYDCSLKSSFQTLDLSSYSAKTSCLLLPLADDAQNDSLVISLTKVFRSEITSPVLAVFEKEQSAATPPCPLPRSTPPCPKPRSMPLAQVRQDNDGLRSAAGEDSVTVASTSSVAESRATGKFGHDSLSSGASPTLRSDLTSSGSTPTGADIHTVLMAQERELRQLREQLDSLLQDRRSASSSVQDFSGSSVPERLTVSSSTEARSITKATECVATMTSFVSDSATVPPPVMPCRCTCSGGCCGERGVAGTVTTSPRSPEVLRRSICDSPVPPTTSPERSLAELAQVDLAALHLTADSQPTHMSLLRVDLHDFSQSGDSYSEMSNILGSKFIASEAQNVTKGRQTDVLRSIREHSPSDDDRSSHYDDLLKMIQDMLSQQDSSPAAINTGGKEISKFKRLSVKERSVFDSVLMPHLNYLSMLSSDLDNNQSIEINVMAHKYLNMLSRLSAPFQSSST